jgi:hypothetical protein
MSEEKQIKNINEFYRELVNGQIIRSIFGCCEFFYKIVGNELCFSDAPDGYYQPSGARVIDLIVNKYTVYTKPLEWYDNLTIDGKLCLAWNGDFDGAIVVVINQYFDDKQYPFYSVPLARFMNAIPLTTDEILKRFVTGQN